MSHIYLLDFDVVFASCRVVLWLLLLVAVLWECELDVDLIEIEIVVLVQQENTVLFTAFERVVTNSIGIYAALSEHWIATMSSYL